MRKFFSSYIFILIPFVALMVTKFLISKPQEILLSTDWSVASFMIFAQCINLIVSENFGNKSINSNGLAIYIGITIILLIICLGAYAYMTVSPDILGGVTQIFLFFLSSVWMCGVYKANEFIKKAT
ncbi:hypothetical protein [Vibrio chagasii]|uniref:hypothetical protein n=1 Tax=Vibrio chagasii TaxID=170679 RepID=UPI002283B9FE|nr:hypothetical protein [Vibrio chagasii]MCY9828612.1 hypothetical protein [Vibrio chagasii]